MASDAAEATAHWLGEPIEGLCRAATGLSSARNGCRRCDRPGRNSRRNPPRHSGTEHKMLDDQLAAAVEEVGEGLLPVRAVEHILLFELDPGQFAPLRAQLVAQPRELFLLRQMRACAQQATRPRLRSDGACIVRSPPGHRFFRQDTRQSAQGAGPAALVAIARGLESLEDSLMQSELSSCRRVRRRSPSPGSREPGLPCAILPAIGEDEALRLDDLAVDASLPMVGALRRAHADAKGAARAGRPSRNKLS